MTGSGVTDGRRQDWFRTSQEEKRSLRAVLSALSVQASRYTGWESPKRPAVRRSHRDGILPGEDHRPLSLPPSAILVGRESRTSAASQISRIVFSRVAVAYR